jgi:centromere protein C
MDAEDEDDANDPDAVSSPSRANKSARRLSANARDGSPLRDITAQSLNTPPSRRSTRKAVDDGYSVMTSIENEYQVSEDGYEEAQPQNFVEEDVIEHETGANEGDAQSEVFEDATAGPEKTPLDDEEVDQTFSPRDLKEQTATANSRRKRKSDGEPTVKATKKARKDTSKNSKAAGKTASAEMSAPTSRGRGRPRKYPMQPPSTSKQSKKDAKDPSGMSERQQKELDEIVEKVKARPNPPRSLYILRRETPADDSVTLTRSGRMSVKPLAYWRNERCVWGGSPNSELRSGTRFPINSIKEIIRTEEHNSPTKKKKGKKGKRRGKSRTADGEGDDGVDDSSSDDDQPEPWEVESGTFRGKVSEWDSEQGAPLNVEQEIAIAHSAQAIQTYLPTTKNGREPPQFKYSKLFSNEFMSVGLVDLPPGGIKKPKNAQKMQMTFYVIKGRVTASVGPVLGDMTTFSIGKGGFWQVPRGESTGGCLLMRRC